MQKVANKYRAKRVASTRMFHLFDNMRQNERKQCKRQPRVHELEAAHEPRLVRERKCLVKKDTQDQLRIHTIEKQCILRK